MDGVAASTYKQPTGLRHAQSLDNVSWIPNPPKKYRPVLNENYPLPGSRGNDGLGSSDSLNRSGDFEQEYYENNNDFGSSSIKPFNNNPPLPNTQRDIVGNNLHFNSSSQNKNWITDENDQLASLLLYRDALKKNLTTPLKAGGGLPKMRHGRIGSQWRHIKQTNTYSGSNLMFIDGSVRIDDSFKYPIPRFGYPPMKLPQHKFSSSNNDLSLTSSKPTTKSFDALTWSTNRTQNQRPSISQYSSRSQNQAKDNFSYGPMNSTYNKVESKHYSTTENNEYEG